MFIISSYRLSKDSDFDVIKRLYSIGYHFIAANHKTNELLENNNIVSIGLESNECYGIKNKEIDLVLDMSQNNKENYHIRRNAIDYNVPLITNDEQIKLLTRSLEKNVKLLPKSYDEYF